MGGEWGSEKCVYNIVNGHLKYNNQLQIIIAKMPLL